MLTCADLALPSNSRLQRIGFVIRWRSAELFSAGREERGN